MGDISTRFQRLTRREKFLSTFFEIFVKFDNKNSIKFDFWGDLCRSISKIFEKSSFLAKKHFYKFRNFRKYFYRGGVTPSKIYLLPTPFNCIFINKFSKIFGIWSFMSGNFFRKISQNFQKISWNFINFLKIEKTFFCN